MKTRLFRSLLQWAALNALVVLPLFWVLTNGMPDRVDWVVRTSRPITVQLYSQLKDGSRKPEASAYFFGKEAPQHYKMWLPETRDEAGLGWEITGDASDCEIKKVSMLKRLFIRKRFDPKASTWSLDWSDRVFFFGVCGGELSLLLLGFVLTFIKFKRVRVGRSLMQSVVVAFFGAALFALIIPAQSFMANRSYFTFGTGDFLWAGCGHFVFSFLALVVILFLSERLWGRFLHVVVTGILVYEYLETGIFAIGQPPINGEMDFFQDIGRGGKDSAYFLVIIGGFALATRWLKRYIHWVAIVFLTLAAVSLLEVKKEPRPSQEGQLISDFASKATVAHSAVYSRNRNVLVFVLDMATSEVVEDVIGRDAALRAAFPGFVCYRNNLGMHMSTDLGTSALLTGEYLEDPLSIADYTYSIFTAKSALKDYQDKDIPMFVCPGSMPFGYTNRKKTEAAVVQEEKKPPFKKRISGQMEWNLFEVVRFRATPFLLKRFVLKLTFINWTNKGEITAESQLYPMIGEGMTTDDGCTFHWYHTIGCHPPLSIDRDGRTFSAPRTGYDAHFEKIYFALRELAKLFDRYRDRGVYDNSTIIVCSDHGANYANGGSFIKGDIPDKAFPFLWVKPSGAVSPLAMSTLPTSHLKISALCRALRDRNLTRQEIEGILRTDDRFYRDSCGTSFLDWHVDATGAVRRVETTVRRDLDKLKPLERGKAYSLEVKSKDKPEVISDLLDMASAYAPRLHSNVESAVIRFRVAGKGFCAIRLRLDTMIAQTGHAAPTTDDPFLEITSGGATKATARFSGTERIEVELPGVEPDEHGIVEIKLIRKGLKDAVFVPRIEVR